MKVLNLGLYGRSRKYQSERSNFWIRTDKEHVRHKVVHFPVSGLA